VNRNLVLALGAAAVLAETALWHGPLGASDRFAGKIERTAQAALQRFEMPLVNARLERSPLRRRLVLSGPADDFQQRELVRMLDQIPGVSGVRWTTPPSLSAEPVK
jgi:type II secretory pathway component PulJ